MSHAVPISRVLAQVSLEICSPIIKRASLRKLMARILDDPELLPPGETDFGEYYADPPAAAPGTDH